MESTIARSAIHPEPVIRQKSSDDGTEPEVTVSLRSFNVRSITPVNMFIQTTILASDGLLVEMASGLLVEHRPEVKAVSSLALN